MCVGLFQDYFILYSVAKVLLIAIIKYYDYYDIIFFWKRFFPIGNVVIIICVFLYFNKYYIGILLLYAHVNIY